MLRQLHALVVDDEPHCRDFLCRQIERLCPSLNILQTATSAREAERLIHELAPDVVFMDIHMPHRSGIELPNSLEHRDFFLVYTTAHHEYAVDALIQKAHDDVLKPIDRDDLVACTRRMIMHFYHQRKPGAGSLSPTTRRLEIHTSGKRHFVRHKDIVHLEAEGSYTTLHLGTGKRITMSKTLKKVEEMLDNEMFFRTHNGHLVQLDRIVACNYRENCVTLDNWSEVPMAVRKREALKRKLSLLMPA